MKIDQFFLGNRCSIRLSYGTGRGKWSLRTLHTSDQANNHLKERLLLARRYPLVMMVVFMRMIVIVVTPMIVPMVMMVPVGVSV
jgi:type II secretory pathway component PulF